MNGYAHLRSGAMRAAAGLLFALYMGAAPAQTAQSNTLRFVVQPEPAHLMPQIDTTSSVQLIGTKIFEPLFARGKNGETVPLLALSSEISQDGKSIRLQLRRGVKWHDGSDFTSADVKFTLEDAIKKNSPIGRTVLGNLESVETPAPDVALLRFSVPSLYVLSTLVGPTMPMLSKRVYEGKDLRAVQATQNPVGTGPFKFVEWRKGSHITLERNAQYWGEGKPHIDQILVRFIRDAASRAVAFESGEVDLAGQNPIPLSDLNRFKSVPTVRVVTTGSDALAGASYFEFNLRNPKFQDKRVRQAFAHALNRRFIANNIWYGYAQPATSVVPMSATPFYNPDLPRFDYDRAKAERLLDEAGFKRGSDGVRMRITHDVFPFDLHFQRVGEYLKQALSQVGIVVELRNQDVATWIRRIYHDNDFETVTYNIFGMTDPTVGIQRVIWGKNIRKGVPFSNGSGYANPEVDKLVEAAQVAATQPERVKYWHQAQQIIADELPNIPLVNLQYTVVINQRVQGVENDGFGPLGNFADITLKDARR
ncbi:MAG: ABC transporter substrate-binding protein [Burkholderiaceae bacterium]